MGRLVVRRRYSFDGRVDVNGFEYLSRYHLETVATSLKQAVNNLTWQARMVLQIKRFDRILLVGEFKELGLESELKKEQPKLFGTDKIPQEEEQLEMKL